MYTWGGGCCLLNTIVVFFSVDLFNFIRQFWFIERACISIDLLNALCVVAQRNKDSLTIPQQKCNLVNVQNYINDVITQNRIIMHKIPRTL